MQAATVREFLQTETAGGLFLLAATMIALVWANSPFAGSYERLWGLHLGLGFGELAIDLDLRHWINDLLMALFFLVVGLEIKRELVRGELREPKVAAVPVAAALGGMVGPALVYLAIVGWGPDARGWGIPMATDIAFATAMLAVLGKRVPASLKLFLLTLAIVDDIGAILVIALVYSAGIHGPALGVGVGLLGLLMLLMKVGVKSPWITVPIGMAVWIAFHESGIHATIAGVAIGLVVPATSTKGGPLESLEHALHPWTSFLVIPLFALANAGLEISGGSIRLAASSRVFWGVAVGLVLGKTIGVVSLSVGSQMVRLGRLSPDITRWRLGGVAVVSGIGFTVSLFITDLAFGSSPAGASAKMGVLMGSLVAAVIGAAILALHPGSRGKPAAQSGSRSTRA